VQDIVVNVEDKPNSVKFKVTDEIPDELPELFELVDFDEENASIWEKSFPTPFTDCVVQMPCCIILIGFAILSCLTGFAFYYDMF